MSFRIADCKNVIFRGVSVDDVVKALAKQHITMEVEWEMVGIGALGATGSIEVMFFERSPK